MSPYWEQIYTYWKQREPQILAAPRNEWAVPVYDWTSIIQLTPIEQMLWGDIREANCVFYPQWPVVGFFVDFANPVAKVVIECDGAQWHQDKGKDARRDAKLRELGWQVSRFSGKACWRDAPDEGDSDWWWRREDRPILTREWIDVIGDIYGVKRAAPKAGMRHSGDLCASVVDHLLEMNQ